jgi:membrane-bound lytic murein transglycosylase B
MAVRRRWIAALLALALAPLAFAVAQAATRGGPSTGTPPEQPEPAPLPALDERVPLGARALAATLRATAARLDATTDAWRRTGDLAAARPPDAMSRLATYEARIIEVLSTRPALAAAVLPKIEARHAHRIAPEVRARRDLIALHRISQRKPGPPPKIRIGRPLPAAELQRHYRDAQQRFGVGWHVLAAVNYVETKFGRYRNESISGARGPMQFMPATWRAYGMGGDVRDPRDAIMGAANYLRASGAPAGYRRALYAYNPSDLYVRTVRMYARRIATDPRAYPQLYAREVLG